MLLLIGAECKNRTHTSYLQEITSTNKVKSAFIPLSLVHGITHVSLIAVYFNRLLLISNETTRASFCLLSSVASAQFLSMIVMLSVFAENVHSQDVPESPSCISNQSCSPHIRDVRL